MKKIILSFILLGLLTACPSEQEVNNMLEGLSEKRVEAKNRILKKDFSLDGLLKMQDYFFDFSEKVHLLKTESDAQKSLNYLIKQNGLNSVCEDFVLPISNWQILNKFCTVGTYYRCSPEMRDYKSTLDLFKQMAGEQASNEAACN